MSEAVDEFIRRKEFIERAAKRLVERTEFNQDEAEEQAKILYEYWDCECSPEEHVDEDISRWD